MSNFFILGLPRSRTAWLANFMTHNGFNCLHDGLNGCNSINDYKTKLGPNSGDSNTGLVLFNFRKYFPTARTVIIDNSIASAVQYAKQRYSVDIAEQLLDAKAKLDDVHGLHISYHDINKKLETIWAYLTHDAPFDAKRAELLVSLDVSVVEPYIADKEAAANLWRNVHGTSLQH